MEPEYYPLWKLETVYWWRTTFPAGQEVKVHHSYKPSVGGTVAMTFIQDGKPTLQLDEYRERYCLDDALLKTAIKLEKQQNYDAGFYYYEKWMSYILTTGANWAGPIGQFKLTVDKGSEKNYVSFCGQNVRKVGPTTFEMTATDFIPGKGPAYPSGGTGPIIPALTTFRARCRNRILTPVRAKSLGLIVIAYQERTMMVALRLDATRQSSSACSKPVSHGPGPRERVHRLCLSRTYP